MTDDQHPLRRDPKLIAGTILVLLVLALPLLIGLDPHSGTLYQRIGGQVIFPINEELKLATVG